MPESLTTGLLGLQGQVLKRGAFTFSSRNGRSAPPSVAAPVCESMHDSYASDLQSYRSVGLHNDASGTCMRGHNSCCSQCMGCMHCMHRDEETHQEQRCVGELRYDVEGGCSGAAGGCGSGDSRAKRDSKVLDLSTLLKATLLFTSSFYFQYWVPVFAAFGGKSGSRMTTADNIFRCVLDFFLCTE